MIYRIYIIGNIPKIIDKKCVKNFDSAQKMLSKLGFEVVNPVDRLMDKISEVEELKRRNLIDLANANAVYLLPCLSLKDKENNFELKLAMSLNVTVISGMFFLD